MKKTQLNEEEFKRMLTGDLAKIRDVVNLGLRLKNNPDELRDLLKLIGVEVVSRTLDVLKNEITKETSP